MLIKASCRPAGIKAGVTTKSLYKSMGLKSESGPDIRDVVGKLELNARNGNETLFLAAMWRALSPYDLGTEATIVILDKSGEEVMRYGKPSEDAVISGGELKEREK